MSYYEMLLAKKNIVVRDSPTYAISVDNLNKNVQKMSKYLEMHVDFEALQEKQKRDYKPSAFNEDGLRVCCICGIAKEGWCYTVNKKSVDGRDARCKECKNELMKQYQRNK